MGVAQQRESISGDAMVRFHKVSVQSAILLSVCLSVCERCLLCAAGEQLSTLIWVAATSWAINYFLFLLVYPPVPPPPHYDLLSCKRRKTFKGSLAVGGTCFSDCWQSVLRIKGIANGILAGRSYVRLRSRPELICLLNADREIGRVTGGSARGGVARKLVVDQPSKSDPYI